MYGVFQEHVYINRQWVNMRTYTYLSFVYYGNMDV